jgi:hypothetical protein
MKRISLALFVSFAACAPASTAPVYVAPAQAPAASPQQRGIAVRGRVPRGKRVDYIVAVQVDRTGKRKRIRVRPAADGSYQLQLPPGHQYAMAYEERGRLTGNVSFPSAGGRQSNVINVSQNVVVNQYVDLGETTYVGGVYVAAYDPEVYLDSDGDGTVDAQDPDDVDEEVSFDASAFEEADVEDIGEVVEDEVVDED